MGRNLLIFTLLLAGAYMAFAQQRILRTSEEVARKQTEMLTRDLDITDSLTRDTIYKVHLRFARMRHPNPTMEEMAQYRDSLTEAMRGILPPEQYQLFLERQAQYAPRYPQLQVNRFKCRPADSCTPPPPSGEPHGEPDTPPPPPGYLL